MRVPHVKWVVHQMWIEATVLRAEFVAPTLALGIPEAWGNRAAAEMVVCVLLRHVTRRQCGVQRHGRRPEQCEYSVYSRVRLSRLRFFFGCSASPRTMPRTVSQPSRFRRPSECTVANEKESQP